MLVLSRRCRESVVLPADGVTIRVLEIRSNRVRLGIEAPSGVSVLRGELLCSTEQEDEMVVHHSAGQGSNGSREHRPSRSGAVRLRSWATAASAQPQECTS
jgi:carbon storage regulator